MVYEEVEIEDMDFDEETGLFTYECPCGDLFQISEVLSAAAHRCRLESSARCGADRADRAVGGRRSWRRGRRLRTARAAPSSSASSTTP